MIIANQADLCSLRDDVPAGDREGRVAIGDRARPVPIGEGLLANLDEANGSPSSSSGRPP
jgi:hypothetical protein